MINKKEALKEELFKCLIDCNILFIDLIPYEKFAHSFLRYRVCVCVCLCSCGKLLHHAC